MVLPLLKLGTLALKTLSKPIASRLKQQAALHPKFRTSIISFARTVHMLANIRRKTVIISAMLYEAKCWAMKRVH
ncbi:hypothetical protein OSB04_008351 [Centaurea solstitialis]|uniref:Uncharacterized protein n=1 Tax=Centaurea solstitialis TaxID=347529 RepID=A0AA38TZD1_9ASTR|nr:hypothetical protein OSB04_008351 [Centaurea solstitialis]